MVLQNEAEPYYSQFIEQTPIMHTEGETNKTMELESTAFHKDALREGQNYNSRTETLLPNLILMHNCIIFRAVCASF